MSKETKVDGCFTSNPGKGIELAKHLAGKVSAALIGDNIEGMAKEIICYGADNVYLVRSDLNFIQAAPIPE